VYRDTERQRDKERKKERVRERERERERLGDWQQPTIGHRHFFQTGNRK
jgi:hypothetical protein